MITRRHLLTTTPFLPLAATAAPQGPNIILLLADDMGWGDPSCYGNRAIATPNIDRLAAQGTRLENFYAASAVCTPSRAAILTGRYPLRFDIRRHFNDDEEHLPPTTTLPLLLKKSGYATAHIGKWHLGGLHQKHIRDRANSIPGPHQHGFDHYLCQNEEQPLRGKLGAERMLYRKGGTCLIRDDQNVPDTDPYYSRHYTDINGDEAVRLLDQFATQPRPFFLNVWWLDPHTPYEPAPEPFYEKASAPGISEDQRRARSMIMHMDHKIGQILRKLEEHQQLDNTLIFFSSDNGGAFEANIGPFKGGKTDLHDGGLRVPGIACWPGRIAKGRVSKQVAHHCDLLPTICAAAGIALPRTLALDGVNLLPHLRKPETVVKREVLLWQIDHYPRLQRHYPKPKPYATEAALAGRWKLLSNDGRPVALYDIGSDREEVQNLMDTQPRVVAELEAQVKRFLTAERDRRGKAPSK
ncbi:MAG: sulfatase-like hydrolase/transferase [Bryobacterales bacterium]|nr:sulfatase-like hydrolase/transferase [Bryobacterales bacterium]